MGGTDGVLHSSEIPASEITAARNLHGWDSLAIYVRTVIIIKFIAQTFTLLQIVNIKWL